tara:strand:- start:30251 stop:30424 length:174 start_codon:yes stop_codon:yes gene_type:complete
MVYDFVEPVIHIRLEIKNQTHVKQLANAHQKVAKPGWRKTKTDCKANPKKISRLRTA